MRTFLSLFLQRLDPIQRCDGVLVASESCQTEVMLTAGSETGSGRTYHVDIFQQIIEELPAGHAVGRFQPDIGSVHTAGYGKSRFF